MKEKDKVEVIIDGRIYQMSGGTSDVYLQQIANYLNDKIEELKQNIRDYGRLEDEERTLLLEINICDDLFSAREETRKVKEALDNEERNAYSAKHDLINTQMKLESALKQLSKTQEMLNEAVKRAESLEERLAREENRNRHNGNHR